ncbi:LysR family transcriptional regulator [Allosaccharopolyspora coralli]|uniref:LysR family transcriptional regulator n=1 Tax=Allosaccharopolyspora coralli TaxID=2665642 RepID=A0A5Q3QL28_9PSEU|nr:LysR family transcriptional regulator [Allosaccharopolyspora coralli]
MEIRQLRYFVAVAEEKNFRRAAERLHVAQPALSQQIRKLEQQLKTTLLERTTRRVELTDAGTVLLETGRRVLAEAEHAETAVRHTALGEIGTLRIGFVSSAALTLVPRIVHALRAKRPGLHVDLTERTTDRQLDAIDDGSLDVGIVREVGSPTGLNIHELAREPLLVALPQTHPLAERESIRLSELADEDFVVFPRGQVSRLYDHIAALCHHAGFRMRPSQQAVQFPTILGLVAAGTGIAVVPDSLRHLQLPGLVYARLDDPEAVSHLAVVCRPDRADHPPVSTLVELCDQDLSGHEPGSLNT